MIVKNEEEVIERCLSSVSDLVDEIIILDTGSADKTKAIISKFTDNIYDFQWIDDFAAARNSAFDKATMDYILWLDADDVMDDINRNRFSALKESLETDVDSVTMEYQLSFDEYGNVIFSLRRNRLVKRANKFRWIGPVHEYLEVGGKIYNSDVSIAHKSLHHDSDRNLRIYEKRLSKGEKFSPRDMYYFANELMDHKKYKRATQYYKQFLGTGKGWVEDNISSCSKLADCYHYLGDYDNELDAVLKSFRYGGARAEFSCRLGYHFLQDKDLSSAIFWYKLATMLKPTREQAGFQNQSFYTWLPYLQLCLCYSQLGEYKMAYLHNEVALQYRPNDQRMLQNQKFLEEILGPEVPGINNTEGKDDTPE
ncbi:tetratricopeptide repeat-containing glycosyltransferase family 2 protein [Ruminiclostridium sufflavum]|nr:glycosyltransferase family 2 protein [Ruminiclostridium sufflavum]